MRTFAISNRKGGVGKTTTAIELAYIFATSCQKRVLLVDADSQGDSTAMLRNCSVTGGLPSVLLGLGYNYEDLIYQTDVPGLDLLPAGEELARLDMDCLLGEITPNFYALRDFVAVLAEDDAYDVVIIDCPPYYSLSCINAIAACDGIIIPTGTDAYSVVGMAGLVDQIDNIRRVCPNVRVCGALVTKWHKADIVEDAVSILRESAPVPIFKTVIRRTDKVEESSWARQAAQQWSPFSSASRDYRAFAAELMAKEGMA